MLFASFASAADPGHGAGSIGAGTFESGNYIFPNNLSVGASGLFANAQSGRVGIGTTEPRAKLEVNGEIYQPANLNFLIGDPYGQRGDLTFSSASNQFSVGANADLSLSSGWNGVITLENGYPGYDSGKVVIPHGTMGIGTTVPGAKLDINGTGVATPLSLRINSQTLGTNGITLINDASGGRTWSINPWVVGTSHAYFGIKDDTAGVTRLTITDTGNMGIGTPLPSQKLEVNGTINVSGSSPNIYVGNKLVCLADGTNCQAISGSSSAAGWTNDSTTTSTSFNVNVGSGKLYVNSTSGNVGIGTTAPTSLFHIYDSSSSSALKIDAPGSYSNLQFANSGNLKGELYWNNNVGSFVLAASSSAPVYIQPTGAGGNIILTQGGGNVGIGTTAPTEKLDVSGGLAFSANTAYIARSGIGMIRKQSDTGLSFTGATGSLYDFTIGTPAGQILFTNPTGTNNVVLNPINGNVGIGTTSPSNKLDVVGNVNVTQNISMGGMTMFITGNDMVFKF